MNEGTNEWGVTSNERIVRRIILNRELTETFMASLKTIMKEYAKQPCTRVKSLTQNLALSLQSDDSCQVFRITSNKLALNPDTSQFGTT